MLRGRCAPFPFYISLKFHGGHTTQHNEKLGRGLLFAMVTLHCGDRESLKFPGTHSHTHSVTPRHHEDFSPSLLYSTHSLVFSPRLY